MVYSVIVSYTYGTATVVSSGIDEESINFVSLRTSGTYDTSMIPSTSTAVGRVNSQSYI